MQTFRIYQNGSKNGRYCISERVHIGNELIHYGVKGMHWGIRKDQLKQGVKKVATKAIDILYDNLEVENFEELKQRGKELLKSPQGVAFLAAVVVLPDPLVFGGIATYNAMKVKGLMDKKVKLEEDILDEIKHSDSLVHYGILGMKWGVRRTPEQLGHRALSKSKKKNFDKWGKSKDTNVLYITDKSGSGKSTVANFFSSNSDVIHLDSYLEIGDQYTLEGESRSKTFEKFLKKSNIRAPGNYAKGSDEYKKALETFKDAVESFGSNQYSKGKKVVVEGLQIQENDWDVKGKPLIEVSTSKLVSAIRATKRDSGNFSYFLKQFKHSEFLDQSDSLTHYGILGMKWGVRRTPEQLGHVKKGTKMYRVTPNPNEKEEGSTYVTYLQPDRDMYRGAFNKQGGFAKYYNIDPKSPMYESVYTNKEDLKVATYDTVKEVTNKALLKDNAKLLGDLCKDIIDEKVKLVSSWEKTYDKMYPDDSKEDKEKVKQNVRQQWLNGNTNFVDYGKSVIKDFSNMTPDELYRSASSRFGKETLLKEAVITELKKQGYNAMIDQASVGGKTRNIEGQAPMIIFDRGEVLEKQSSNKISNFTRDIAANQYNAWYNWVNSSEKRKQNWD